MDKAEKLLLLDQQIAEANHGSPADFQLWRQKTEVVLRNVLGDANPLYSSFEKIRYTLAIVTERTPDSAYASARKGGVRRAISVLEAAKLEVELSGGRPETPMGVPDSIGIDLFIVHGHDEARK